MGHEDDARVADLVAPLGDGDGTDLFPRFGERGMQDLIDAELTAAIGAEPHERTESRLNQRNGARPRTLSTPAGDVELRIPKLRVGSFYPSLLEPRRRVDRALWRSEEHTSELQSLMRISYAVFCLKKQKQTTKQQASPERC